MSLCNSCKYQYYVEQLKPCIIRRDDCEFYEYDGISKEEHYESCDACDHLNETDGSHCYECVKGMKDNRDSQESNMEDIAKAFLFGFALGFGESEEKCKNCEYYINPDYTRCHECKTESEGKR